MGYKMQRQSPLFRILLILGFILVGITANSCAFYLKCEEIPIPNNSTSNSMNLRVPYVESGETSFLGVPYVERREWIAQPARKPATKLEQYPPPYVIISHTATDSCENRAQCIYIIRYLQNFHIESKNWDDIGYNFLVGGDGAIYEGRGWDVEGAHTYNYNKKSIGISFVGAFTRKSPTDRQIYAAKKLIEYGMQNGKIAKDYKLLGHRQLIKTESPGEELYNNIKTWSHWSPTP